VDAFFGPGSSRQQAAGSSNLEKSGNNAEESFLLDRNSIFEAVKRR
jgi:hypothetical protein